MKNKRKKLRAAGLTFLALLGGVIGVTAVSTTLVSCNKDTIPATHKVVLNTSNVEITEQKTLDNGDLEATFSLDKTQQIYGVESAAIVRNKNQAGKLLVKDTDYTITIGKDNGIVLLKHDSFKNYTDENITMTIWVTYIPFFKSITLNKTNIKVKVDSSEEIVASLSDQGTGVVLAEIKSDVITITTKGNNTFSVNGEKVGNTTITFECDGYKSATLNVDVIN